MRSAMPILRVPTSIQHSLNSFLLDEVGPISILNVRFPWHHQLTGQTLGQTLGDTLVADHTVLHWHPSEDGGVATTSESQHKLVPFQTYPDLLKFPFR